LLFDLKPKTKREELFGRQRELDNLLSSMMKYPLTLIAGVRRIGKTSLLKTALGECTHSVMYLDARRLEEEGYTRQALYELFSEELSSAGGLWFKAKDYLKRVKGVHLGLVGVDIDWDKGGARLSSLFRALDEWASEQGKVLVIAVDGAQVLRRLAGGKGRINFVQLIAYSYDNLTNTRFVLTGSEVGLLHEFLGLENPESALYARGYNTITLERFDRETSLGFLEAGFRELGVKVSKELLNEVVGRLDGLVGWLTLFGYTASEGGAEVVLEEVLRKSKGIVKKEIDAVLRRSNHYKPILKALSQGKSGWSQLKRELINQTGRFISDAQFNRALTTLVSLSLVEHNQNGYIIPDPILAEVATEL
jgi:AAA+ ATPase superfamily predicted ATPase